MKTNLFLLGALTLLFAACQDELQQPDNQAWGGIKPLSISVISTPTKAQVSGTLLPVNSELGVFVTKPDGSDYLAENPYNNIKYTGTGETNATTWTVDPSTPVYLNSETATAYAYYPRQASYNDLTSIPITNDGTDWMYSAPVENLDFQNATAPFSLQHAMSIIRIKIERVNASDYGTISKVTIDGNSWATGATLNLKESIIGAYTGENSQLVKTDVGELGASALTYDHWVVPTGNTSDLTFKVTMDGKTYKSSLPNVTLVAGKVYNYKLTVSNTAGLSINEVTMTDWDDLAETNMDTEYEDPWTAAKATDGVYAIKADGNPMAYAEASTTSETLTGVAFVLNGKAYQVAKTEISSRWDDEDYIDIEGVTNYTKVDGTNSSGYLAGSSTPQLSTNYNTWIDGALSDFNGAANTTAIIKGHSDGTLAGSLGKAVKEFSEGSNNESYTDWFVPACGELAFMCLKMTELNTLLSKVPATQFSTSIYWSSSECNSYRAWSVNFSNGYVFDIDKYSNDRVRLVRAI